MLTKTDKKYISNIIKENNNILLKEMIELFSSTNGRIDAVNERIDDTNKRIDASNERIDKLLTQLKDHNDILDAHERRIEKVEEKTFPISA